MEQADRDCIALDTALCSIVRAATRGSRARGPWQPGWTSVLASCSSPIAGSSTTLRLQEPRTIEHHRGLETRLLSRLLRTTPLPNRLRPRQIGRVEARAEQNLGLADALQGSHDVQ